MTLKDDLDFISSVIDKYDTDEDKGRLATWIYLCISDTDYESSSISCDDKVITYLDKHEVFNIVSIDGTATFTERTVMVRTYIQSYFGIDKLKDLRRSIQCSQLDMMHISSLIERDLIALSSC